MRKKYVAPQTCVATFEAQGPLAASPGDKIEILPPSGGGGGSGGEGGGEGGDEPVIETPEEILAPKVWGRRVSGGFEWE